MRPASRENGSDCSHTVPGPVSVARNTPSPPNSMLLMPPTAFTSMSTVSWKATTQPVSTSSRSPAASSRLIMVPPACTNTQPSPSSFCMMKPSPPNRPVRILRWKKMPSCTPRAPARNASFWQISRPPWSESFIASTVPG